VSKLLQTIDDVTNVSLVDLPACQLHRIQNPAMKIENYVFDGVWKETETIDMDAEDSE
jgi:hypothetical protein